MVIKTKKTRLSPSKYIKIALLNVLRQQWWLMLPVAALTGVLIYLGYAKWSFIPGLLLLLYALFWLFQFYSLTKMEENQLLFGRLFYELNNDRLIIFLDSKRGMPIDWKQIKSVRLGKKSFMFMLSRIQFIYLPFSAFQNAQQIKLAKILLQNKKLL